MQQSRAAHECQSLVTNQMPTWNMESIAHCDIPSSEETITVQPDFSGTKSSPRRKPSGQMSRGGPGVIHVHIQDQTCGQALEILARKKKQACLCGHPWHEPVDIHDSRRFQTALVRKTSGWVFVASLCAEKRRGLLSSLWRCSAYFLFLRPTRARKKLWQTHKSGKSPVQLLGREMTPLCLLIIGCAGFTWWHRWRRPCSSTSGVDVQFRVRACFWTWDAPKQNVSQRAPDYASKLEKASFRVISRLLIFFDFPYGDCRRNVQRTRRLLQYRKRERVGRKRKGRSPPKSHIANFLGGHRLDEQSGRRLVREEKFDIYRNFAVRSPTDIPDPYSGVSKRSGSGPKCALDGPPLPSIALEDLPSSHGLSLPSLPLPLPPNPPGSFCNAPGEGGPGWRGGGVLWRRVGGGGPSKRHLGSDPHLAVWFQGDFVPIKVRLIFWRLEREVHEPKLCFMAGFQDSILPGKCSVGRLHTYFWSDL